jgi:EmrB/QacA subfamily drug resistance transporter
VVLSGFFMILLDGTIVNVAIPPIQQDLSANYSAAQWMMSGYALAYAVCLIPAGRLGDMIGHKRMFIIGLSGFTLSSAGCALADSPLQIVLWRAVQGATGGLMTPSVLAMIAAVFPAAQRGRAMVRYGATAGVATSLGPVLGGAIIAADLGGLGWRPIFLINLPIGVAALVAAVRLLPERRGRAGSPDLLGIGLLTLTLMLLCYPLIQGYENDWPAWVFVMLAAVLPASWVFVRWQAYRVRTGRSPLIDVRLFRIRAFTAGVLVTVCQFIAFASLMFVLSAHLQLGLGASALATGLALLPFAIGTFVGSTFSNIAVLRYGRQALHLGSGLLTLGTAGVALAVWIADTSVDGWWLAPPTFVAGAGAMMLGVPLINIVMSGAPDADHGIAGGILATGQRIGHALGIAVVGTVLFSVLPAGAQHLEPGVLPDEYTTATLWAAGACLLAAAITHLLVYLLPNQRGSASL